ncbi:MAG: hypothetical protein WC107_01475 [Patescibacteria group bacterium]
MQLPSTDVFIGLIFAFGIGYGFILQKDKVITYLCSVYIGIVIATSFSQTVFDFFNGNKVIANEVWIKGNASASTIAIVLFLISVIFVSGAINSRGKKSDDISVIEVFFYSVLTVALILSSILGFLPEASRNHYLEISKSAHYLYLYRALFVITPPIMLIVINWKKKDK